MIFASDEDFFLIFGFSFDDVYQIRKVDKYLHSRLRKFSKFIAIFWRNFEIWRFHFRKKNESLPSKV